MISKLKARIGAWSDQIKKKDRGRESGLASVRIYYVERWMDEWGYFCFK
jgi:hypothetical protein